MLRPISILTAFCICVTISVAQPLQTAEHLLGTGISIRGGLGHLAIRDQYISDEKYSGTLPSFGVSWLRGDTSSAYRLGFNYDGSSDIRNNNVSAQVVQSRLDLDFLHSIGKFRLFSHDVFAYIGPSTETFLYYRQQRIASGGNAFFNAYSVALFFSLSAIGRMLVFTSSRGRRPSSRTFDIFTTITPPRI